MFRDSDTSALLLAATSSDVELLAVNVNYPSSYSAVATSTILAHYGAGDVPIGLTRPFTDTPFFDNRYYARGEYASKIAYNWPNGSIPWGLANNTWDPVLLYRKVLAEAEDASVTIASIGFLNNLSGLLNSTGDSYSPLSGLELVEQKVSELVVMGGGYPSGYEWNFRGFNASLTRHVIHSWPENGPIVYLGYEEGVNVVTGKLLMNEGPASDPVRMAYIYYTFFAGRSSWDPLTVLYAMHGLGDLFELGNEYGYNFIEPNGTNRWVWDESRTNQHFLRLKVDNVTAAANLDKLYYEGALSATNLTSK